jgi:Mn2+/Fe2+ NRAMP family transporter
MVKKRKLSFGPGFLVTAAFIGPGTITSCSLAGANFGYSLIYALIFAVIMTLILQEMTGRLSLGSGHDLGQSLREFPKNPMTKLLFAILTLSAITFGCAAYEAGNIIGGSLGLEMITAVPQKIWVAIISLVFLMSISFLATLIIIKPDISAIFKGFIPSFPDGSLMLVLALVGTTVVPYNLFLHSSSVKEKWSSPKNLKDIKRDLLVAICLGGMISISVVITSASAFNQEGIVVEKGIQLAQQLKPLFGKLTNILFGLGFFAAGMSSAITAPYAAAFASSGILGWEGGQNSPKFKGVWLVVILTGFIVSLFGFSPLAVIIFAQVANGLILPIASIFLLVILNNRKHMGTLANNWKQNILGGLVILAVSFLGIWNIARLF